MLCVNIEAQQWKDSPEGPGQRRHPEERRHGGTQQGETAEVSKGQVGAAEGAIGSRD